MSGSPKDEKEIICDCTGTSKEKVLSLIAQNADLDKISSATGACTGCGSCDVDIMNLIDEHTS
ncbi:MAG: (2Fe-2S)-binding protein [Methylococcales bacterium]|nr:(2Fe-2S)-binding protein [Methylococcales bacterium]